MTVAVVGAGAAGLACAGSLAENGCPVEVFEASSRVGGRVLSWSGRRPTDPADPAAQIWELGAQMVHGAGRTLLTGRYGMDVAPAPRSEFAFLIDGAAVPVWRAHRCGISPWELAGRLPATGDGCVAQWLQDAVPAGSPARVARAWFEQEWACAAESLSVPGAAAWVTDRAWPVVGPIAGGRPVAAGPTADFGSESVVPLGMSSLIGRLAAGLDVHCDDPVRRVCVSGPRPWIEVHGSRIDVDAVVLTVPPWTISDGRDAGLVITGVPAAQVRAARSLPGGDAVAAVISWSHPAPSDRTVFDVDGHGFLRVRAGRAQIQIVSKGPAAAALRATLDDPGRLSCLVRGAFRWTDGGRPADIVVADWGRERFIGGAFSAPTPGHLTARRALRGLSGSGLYLAGEATRVDGTAGRLHGAVQSGIDAAAHILDAFAGRQLAGTASALEGAP